MKPCIWFRKFFSIFFLCANILAVQGQAQMKREADSSGTTAALMLDSASVFFQSPQEIHAIAFDHKGMLYAAGNTEVFTIAPDRTTKHFAALDHPGPATTIWSMTFSRNGNLYLAAHDRIVLITPGGMQQVIIQENFPGPCGATDVRFDRRGNLYVAYDNVIAKYDTSYHKSIFIDGSKFQTPIKWAVGLELSSDEQYMYVGDCDGSRAYIVPIAEEDFYQRAKIYRTRWGQYFTKDTEGTIFLSSLGGYRTMPEFVMFTQTTKSGEINCTRKPLQDEHSYKKTIAFGEAGYDEQAIYCVIGNLIYSYHLYSQSR
jgi:hypothetical protein